MKQCFSIIFPTFLISTLLFTTSCTDDDKIDKKDVIESPTLSVSPELKSIDSQWMGRE